MKNKFYFILHIAIVIFLFICCSKDSDEKQEPSFLNVHPKTAPFRENGGEFTVEVEANREWRVQNDDLSQWIKAEKLSQKALLIKVEPTESQREGSVILATSDGVKQKVRVIQTGVEPVVRLVDNNQHNITVTAEGSELLRIDYLTNVDTELIIPESASEWIQETELPDTRSATVVKSIGIAISAHEDTHSRSATLRIQSVHHENVYDEVVVTQEEKKSDVESVVIPNDIRLKVTGGRDSEHQPNQDISKSYDGKYNTTYHSIWNQSARFPVILEYFFEGNRRKLDYIVYHSNNGNGNFGRFRLFIRSADSDYQDFGEYDFKNAGGSHIVRLKKAIVPAAVKFEVYSGNANFVNCKEMEFYEKSENPVDSQLEKVFTDKSCRALKDGYTQDDLSALPQFFQTVAKNIKEHLYTEEEERFRIQSYSAYSSPEYWASKLCTNCYSHLGNPTGIVTNANEEIIVLADGIGYNSVKLLCLPGIGPGNGEEILLKDGVNRLSFSKSGNLFVIYALDDPRNAPAVWIHFPRQSYKGIEHARVGYNVWDLSKDKSDDVYRNYLRKAVSVDKANGEKESIFILKGKKILFTVLTELLRNQETFKHYGVKAGVERWDNLMRWEQDLAAITPYVKSGQFNTVMHVTTHAGGMYATNYHINMAGGNPATKDDWGFKNNFDPRDMDKAQDNQWGPGHELGHMHQGAINWISTTESSNNLFSNYVVYKIGKWGSRGSSLMALANFRYVQKVPWARFMHPLKEGSTSADFGENRFFPYNITNGEDNKHGLYQGEASEMHMRLNQQLWTYFDRIGMNPGTMNRIFEQGRTSFKIPWRNPGRAQLVYAENVAKAANMDMTEFFDTWGFFIPVQKFRLREYAEFDYEVTPQMIEDTKRFMKQFAQKCPPIQYIEDRYYDKSARGNQKGISGDGADVGYFLTYKNKIKITKNVSYTLHGRNYSIHDGDEAVAFEFRRDNEVIYFSNRFNFTVPDAVDLSGSKLYAVQYDGLRKVILQQ